MSDSQHDTDDDPQGGYDVQCWRTPDELGHRFNDDTYHGTGCGASTTWTAMCGASLIDGLPDPDPVDCMTCIVKEARNALD